MIDYTKYADLDLITFLKEDKQGAFKELYLRYKDPLYFHANPSPVILPGGKVYLMYKSSAKNYDPPLLLGAAAAKSFRGPYKRLSDEPLFQFHTEGKMDNDVEDPFVWWEKDHYELIMKDRFGHICGEEGGGIHALSKDGVKWELSNPVKAYSRNVLWDDGTTTKQGNFERPFLLFENGKATHLFAATGSGDRPYELTKSWNLVIPLKWRCSPVFVSINYGT